MYSQPGLFIYRFRYALSVLLVLVCLLLFSALVSALGANSALAGTDDAAAQVSDQFGDSPNAVANSFGAMIAGVQRTGLKTASSIYRGCHFITELGAHSGDYVTRGGAGVLHGVGSSTTALAHGVVKTVGLPVQAAGSGLKLAGSMTGSHAVADIIRPADNKPTPVITNQTSAVVLAKLDAQQKQLIADLQAQQLAANQQLDGAIVAGDPHHGGYPASWDAPAPQDSRLDSWGMYNRECVSYAAWKVYQTFGYMPYWGGVGNASQWVGDAQAAGIAIGSVPRVHSVAISQRGYYGHAMWVEAVSGPMIYVSQYNYGLDGRYSEMWVNGSSFTYIYFR